MRRLWLAAAAIAGIAVVMPALTGCNTAGCTDNHSALPMMGFYNMATKSPVILDSLELGGVGAPDDSLLIKSGSSVQWLYFPLRFDSEQTSFRFHYDYKEQGLDKPELDDILTIRYTSEPYFASEECGAFYVYRVTGISYTKHLIDSVAVVDSVINNIDMERFKVFFRIAEPETPEEPENPEEPEQPENPGQPDEPDEPADNPAAQAERRIAL
jgi:serine-rich protein